MSIKNRFFKNLKILKSKSEYLCKEECVEFLPHQLILRRRKLMKEIQQIIIDMVTSISKEEAPSIIIANPKLWKNSKFDEILSLRCDEETSWQTISFSAINSQAKLSKTLFVLSKIYRLLTSDSYCTVRELYYENVDLFKSQSNLQSVLNTICCILDALPYELSLLTTSKGLIVGSLIAQRPSGKLLDCNKPEGVLIPQDVVELTDFRSFAKFVLVVEKDAIFQKLLDERVVQKFGPCIIITGKGFPDINTRLMLRKIWEQLKLPIFALVDCDPYGIDIMCVYRFGSLNMSQQSKMLAVPTVQWLGIHPKDITELNIKSVKLTSDDLRKAISLKSRPYIVSNPNLLSQIQMMIESNSKCEIESLSQISPSYLTDVYIWHKICCKDLI